MGILEVRFPTIEVFTKAEGFNVQLAPFEEKTVAFKF
jgi:hypothetical protein